MFSRITPLLTLATLALASTPTDVLGDFGSIDNVATAFQGALALVPLSPTVANAELSHIEAAALGSILQSATANAKGLGPLSPSDIADICDKFTSDFAPTVTNLLKQVNVSKESFEAVDAEEELCSDITNMKDNINAYTNTLMEKAKGLGCANANDLAAQVNAQVADTAAKVCAN